MNDTEYRTLSTTSLKEKSYVCSYCVCTHYSIDGVVCFIINDIINPPPRFLEPDVKQSKCSRFIKDYLVTNDHTVGHVLF